MELTDLTVEDLSGSCVLMYLDPVLVVAQIVGNGRMNDSGILAVDLGNAVLLHLGYCLGHHSRGEGGHNRCGCFHLGRHSRSSTGNSAGSQGDVVAVQHIGVGQQCITDQDLLGLCSGCAHLLGSGQDGVIISTGLQHIGNSSVGTVLVDAASLDTHAELLTGGDNTFLQLGSTSEGVELTPFAGNAVLSRQHLGLGKLSIEHLSTSVLQKLSIIEGLELTVEAIAGIGGSFAGVSVDHAAGSINSSTGFCKHLQVHRDCQQNIDNLFHNNFSFLM